MLSKNYENSHSSKLLCTFTLPENLDSTIEMINNHYSVLGSKIYVLNLENDDQYALTYNVEQGNIKSKLINTIAIHRDKDNDVLYTIDALEQLNKETSRKLNEAEDSRYHIKWPDYRRTLILTRSGVLSVIGTKLKSIVNL